MKGGENMAQEAIERTILTFNPEKGVSCYEKRDLGRVKGTPFGAVYRILPYQQRVINLPGEPLIAAWTSQPVVALKEVLQDDTPATRYKTLAYASDIRSLPDGIAEKLAAHLENWQSLRRKITGDWDV